MRSVWVGFVRSSFGLLFVAAAVQGAFAQAETIVQWTFESGELVPINNTATISDIGAEVGTGVASGVHASDATDYTAPAGNGSARSFSSNNWDVGDYYQFETSTTGYSDVTFTWDQYRSGTGPGTFDVLASTNGTDFTLILDDYTVYDSTVETGKAWTPSTYYEVFTSGPIELGAEFADQATVYIRLVCQVTPGGAGGTNRVDNVTVEGAAPECEEAADCPDDGYTCTTEICDNGTCSFEMGLDCSDGYDCTIDSCDPDAPGADETTGCVSTPDDGACTPDDYSCTADTCDPDSAGDATGCVSTPVDSNCSDGVPCTIDACDPDGDADADGCTYTESDAYCDDNASCTTDTCDPAGDADADGCVITPNHGSCNDGHSCTTDSCDPDANGADDTSGCLFSPDHGACADNFTCTTDSCDPDAQGADQSSGCLFAPDHGACADTVDCTTDSCDPADPGADETSGCLREPDDGACDDDDNVCTDAVCTLSGCTTTDNTNSCDDDNACTLGDACKNGSCIGGSDTPDCNDDNSCTDDACNPASGCVNVDNDSNSCSDGNVCTTTDFCSSGSCVGSGSLACDDGNICTSDSCNPSTGCVFTNNTVPCNDGSADTWGDTCNGRGSCVGTAVVCDPPNQCQTAGIPNGTASCPPVNKPATATCDDGLLTTRDDHCNGRGGCTGTTIVCPTPNQCELEGTPNGVDCDPNYKSSGTACDDRSDTTANDVCDGQGGCAGTVIECPTPTNCQTEGTPDGVTCTPVNRPAGDNCDDGDATTTDDRCDGEGGCVGTPIECPEETVCAAYEPNGVDCTLLAKDGPCDDEADTTHSDVCVEGVCQGTPYACAPEQCEASSVANGTDCTVVYKEMGEPCDDGALTTRDDVCDGSGGCAGTEYSCTPAVCEASSVHDGSGCVTTPALPGDSCDDLDGCTIDDICDGVGDCMGEPVVCGDGEVCDGEGGCKVTHCVSCGDDEECGPNSACVALEEASRCLVACEVDLDCGLNQVCAVHPDGDSFCYDDDGACAAPGEDPEEVETVEEVEEAEDVEETEEVEEAEPGPEEAETAEPVVEAAEPDATDGGDGAVVETVRRSGSDDDCSGGGTSSALVLLLALGILLSVRRRATS